MSSVVSGASRETIARAVNARNRADLPDALLSLVLASFFCLLLLFLVNVFLFFLLLERLFWGTRLAWVVFLDRQRSRAHRHGARCLASDARGVGEAAVHRSQRRDAAVILNALNNVVLAGPHQLREGIDTLRRIRARRHVVTQLAALAVLQWIERQGRVSEIQMAKYLSGIPERSDGFRLACELGFVVENATSGSTAYQVSAI